MPSLNRNKAPAPGPFSALLSPPAVVTYIVNRQLDAGGCWTEEAIILIDCSGVKALIFKSSVSIEVLLRLLYKEGDAFGEKSIGFR